MTAATEPTPEQRDATAPYLDAVRSVLAGAPASTREELLDDLASHLAELAAEPDAPPLSDRLGSPDAYAADLVASAGIDVGDRSRPATPREPVLDRARRWWAGQRVVAVRRFLPELRPGWWVLRGYVAVCALAALVDDASRIAPIPEIGNAMTGLLLVLAAVVVSVQLGRRGPGAFDRFVTFGGAAALLVTAVAIGDTQYVYADSCCTSMYGVLTAPDGRPITNIWPYDGEGKPIDGVLLVDQDGQPLEIGEWQDGSTPAGAVVVPGLFPRPQVTYSYNERTGAETPEPATPPNVSVPRLPTTTTTDTVTAGSTTTTAPPTETTVPPDALTTTTPPPPAG